MFTDLNTGLAELIEVSIHAILWAREIYPKDAFSRSTIYETSVLQCEATSVRTYISRVINAVSDELSKGSLSRIFLIITEDNVALERYVFSFRRTAGATRERGDNSKNLSCTVESETLRNSLRQLLSHIDSSTHHLQPLKLSEGTSFSIVLESFLARGTNEDSNASLLQVLASPAEPPDNPDVKERVDLNTTADISVGSVNISLCVQERKDILIDSLPKSDPSQ